MPWPAPGWATWPPPWPRSRARCWPSVSPTPGFLPVSNVYSVGDLLIETDVLPWAPLYMTYTAGFTLFAVSAMLLHRFVLPRRADVG